MKTLIRIPMAIRYNGTIPERVQIAADNDGEIHLYASLKTKPADVKQWKEPPHLVLANLLVGKDGLPDLRALEKFTRTYGLLEGYELFSHVDKWIVDPKSIRAQQNFLRGAWERKGNYLTALKLEREVHAPAISETKLSFEGSEAHLQIGKLWSLIVLLFQYDHSTGRAQICAVKDCPRNRYFLQDRRGQKFCSHPCAVLSNMRKIRALEKSRKRGRRKR
jgi:hypothetical protein